MTLTAIQLITTRICLSLQSIKSNKSRQVTNQNIATPIIFMADELQVANVQNLKVTSATKLFFAI